MARIALSSSSDSRPVSHSVKLTFNFVAAAVVAVIGPFAAFLCLLTREHRTRVSVCAWAWVRTPRSGDSECTFPVQKLYERAIGARCRSRGMRGPRLILAEPFSAHSFDHSFSNFSNLHNFSTELCSFGSFFFPHSGAIYSGRCSSFLAAAAAYTFC